MIVELSTMVEKKNLLSHDSHFFVDNNIHGQNFCGVGYIFIWTLMRI